MERRLVLVILFSLCIVEWCVGDMYLHNPRGSNNRLNEQSANRANGNRMFDSQNNNRGGYNVGDKTDQPAGNDQANQYRMKYFQSGKYVTPGDDPAGMSELVIEWTNQHGCGGNEDTDPHKLNCNIVLQMMCQDDSASVAPNDGITLRDGSSTDTQNYNKIDSSSTKAQFNTQKNSDTAADKGLQEPWFFYDDCNRRERNKGLFNADQNLNGDSAIYTRQNPQGTRRGYECSEERDHYPYWHPTPFIDIAVLAQNESLCDYYRENSFNTAPKHTCVESFAGGGRKHFSEHNNEADCTAGGGTWTEYYNMLETSDHPTEVECNQANVPGGPKYKWGKPWQPEKINQNQEIVDQCFVQPAEVDCRAASWSRSNHLGNGRDGVPLNYTWVLPYFPSGNKKRCIFRARYNISTDDYDPYFTDASDDGTLIEQNPLVDVGANGQSLRLAINTAQLGRTFQDRSHVFTLDPRPEGVEADARIHNLNARGKRGNIVQVFPAVEYDFFPNRLLINEDELIHIQWTGSNTHNNGNPGGDGQTGDAGEGKKGTDRHNICQTLDPNHNFPVPSGDLMTMQQKFKVKWSYNGNTQLTQDNIALILATGGYYECIESCSKPVDGPGARPKLDALLDNANASFEGILVYSSEAGEYFYICTRNNNFTNRSQKGHIIVQ